MLAERNNHWSANSRKGVRILSFLSLSLHFCYIFFPPPLFIFSFQKLAISFPLLFSVCNEETMASSSLLLSNSSSATLLLCPLKTAIASVRLPQSSEMCVLLLLLQPEEIILAAASCYYLAGWLCVCVCMCAEMQPLEEDDYAAANPFTVSAPDGHTLIC